MYEIKYILHNNLTVDQLEEIINIKSIAWPYSYEKQLEWFSNNLNGNDIHLLLYLNSSLVGYLNLIEIEILVDGVSMNGFGIGNVCAREKGKGWGTELIVKTNLFLLKSNKFGLLFCKDSIVPFYELQNWKIIRKEKLKFSFDNDLIKTMIFNMEKEFQVIVYFGRTF